MLFISLDIDRSDIGPHCFYATCITYVTTLTPSHSLLFLSPSSFDRLSHSCTAVRSKPISTDEITARATAVTIIIFISAASVTATSITTATTRRACAASHMAW